ncbi:hypothetical protein DITRI_Ditri02bG0063800 [Diplodiscus trichospermus]
MGFEVTHVAGIEDCFVSLPLLLIQTLQSTLSSLLPPLLSLECRFPRASDHHWIVLGLALHLLPPPLRFPDDSLNVYRCKSHNSASTSCFPFGKGYISTIEPLTEERMIGKF